MHSKLEKKRNKFLIDVKIIWKHEEIMRGSDFTFSCAHSCITNVIK